MEDNMEACHKRDANNPIPLPTRPRGFQALHATHAQALMHINDDVGFRRLLVVPEVAQYLFTVRLKKVYA